jgi:tetratricopeptide (TPR) repeat protein
MARHLSGTSEPSMAARRHSERTTLPLSSTVNNMGLVFDNQGEYGKALEWYQRALDGCEKTLGKDHPSTLDTVNNMGLVFDNQGEYGKALEWYQRALDGKEKTLGKDHPSTLDTVNNMGSVFDNQGEYGKALEWYQRALDGCEKTLGKDHPSTLRHRPQHGPRFSTSKGSMARHLSGTSEPSMATRRHSERTTLPLSAPSTTWA